MVGEPVQSHFQRCLFYCARVIVSDNLCCNIEYKRNVILPVYFILYHLPKGKDEGSILY